MTSSGWSPLGFNIGPANAEPRVFIALPVYGGLFVEFVGTLLNCLTQLNQAGLAARIEFLQGDSLVPRARNNLVHHWLTTTSIPFLLFLDTDLVLDPEGLKRLVSHPPELGVIGGCYPKKKTGPAEWVCNPIPNVGPLDNGLQEVWEMGTGMLRIHRSVCAAIKAAYPQYIYTCDGNHDERVDYFPVGTFPDPLNKRNRYLSEDWAFCQLARAIGFKIWADTKCAARHIGQIAYPFPPEEQVKAPAPGSSEKREAGSENTNNDASAPGGTTAVSSAASPPPPPAPPGANDSASATPPGRTRRKRGARREAAK